MWGANAGAAAAGLVLAALLRRGGAVWAAVGLLLAATAAATVLGPELDPELNGVRRWLALGPLRVQPGLLAVPALVVASLRRPGWAMAAAVAVLAALLAWQPDRGSATALVAGLVAAALVKRPALPALLALAAAGAGAVAAWLRPDPLAPVRFVEGVIAQGIAAGGESALLIAIGIAALLLPGLVRRDALPLTATFAALLAMAVVGPYPTPLLGYGVSGVLGWFVGAALLPGAVRARNSRSRRRARAR